MSESFSMTDTPQSLTERFKQMMEIRRLSDPRIESLLVDMKLNRTETRGNSVVCNLALGNSRQAVSDVETLKANLAALREIVLIQADTITGMQTDMAKLQERIENMAQWAKTVGKQ